MHNPSIWVPPLQANPLAAVGSALGAWFGGQKVYSGAEIESIRAFFFLSFPLSCFGDRLTCPLIVGGPNRPPPKQRPLPGGPPLIIAATKRTKPDASGASTPNSTQYIQDASESARDIVRPRRFPPSLSFSPPLSSSPFLTSLPRRMLICTVAQMTRTNAALEQRGEYLGYLQERLGSMATDAANFAAETKKTAQTEAAKRSAGSFFSSMLNKLP
jgi:syntaxin-binding protein 5